MRDYFNEAEYFAHENYSNYGGDWDYMAQDSYNYMDDYDYAGGCGQGQSPKASLPFILNVANSTTTGS